MVEQMRADEISEEKFKLLSVATLLKKIQNGISLEELHEDAQRKFDTLVELLSDSYSDDSIISSFGYSLDELKKISLTTFNRLITEGNANPYMVLCVPYDAAPEEVRRRRNKLLYIFHPDRKWAESTDGTKTRMINEAFEDIVKNHNRKNTPFTQEEMTVPPFYYPYRGKYRDRRLIFFLIVVIFLVIFWGFMTKMDFF